MISSGVAGVPPLAFTREQALELIEAVQGVLDDLEAYGMAGDD